MIKKGLSIRYKILVLLTILPLITLLLYLVFVAIRVFEEDKVAYVFETNSSLSKSIGSQIQTEIKGVLSTAKPIFQDYASTQNINSASKINLQNQKSIYWIGAYRLQNTGTDISLNLIQSIAKDDSNPEFLAQAKSYEAIKSWGQEFKKQNSFIKFPYNDHQMLVVEKVKEDLVFLVMSDVSDLIKTFNEPMAAKIYLVNSDSRVLLGSESAAGGYLTETIDFSNKEIMWSLSARNKNLSTGTAQVTDFNNNTVLVSYSLIPYADLSMVVTVDKKAALQSVDVLVRKSIYFFGLLLAVTTIISLLASRKVTQSLSMLYHATKKVAEGHFQISVPVQSNDEVGSLAESFNVMASEVSRLLNETAEKARMESELKTAQTVQETLFPATEADIAGLKISGFYEPASECGGDWWYYSEVQGKIYLWIGDATGHGAAAALITSAARSAASIIEKLAVTPAEALEYMNRSIYDVSKGRLMMTFFVACFDPLTGVFQYSNASHEAPFLFHKSDQELKKKDLIPLNDVNNPRIGQSRETVYKQTEIILKPGDRILFYTDGIPDIQDKNKTAWGERAFIKALLQSASSKNSTSVAVKQMVDLFSKHRQHQSLIDDITFFLVQYLD